MKLVTYWEFDMVKQSLKITEKAFSMLELWEKSKVYNGMDARTQREEAVMELFQMLKEYDESRYLYIKRGDKMKVTKSKPPDNWEDIKEFEDHCTCKEYDWPLRDCPYAYEINEEEVECNCCPFCAQNCRDNI